jgi:hypothetical protein
MSRRMVGLLAAVASAMSALTGLMHGFVPWFSLVTAALASGLAAYLALPPSKKNFVHLLFSEQLWLAGRA